MSEHYLPGETGRALAGLREEVAKLEAAVLKCREAVTVTELVSGSTSDGYHTFDELYEHRHWLFLSLMKAVPERAWASRLHSDGSSFDGWFIAGIELSDGKQISYHLPDRLWSDIEHLGVQTTSPPHWDGHLGDNVITRLRAEFRSTSFWGASHGTLEKSRRTHAMMKSTVARRTEQRDQLLVAIEGLKRGQCWCEVAVGNPMMRGIHGKHCDAVRKLVAKVKGGDGAS